MNYEQNKKELRYKWYESYSIKKISLGYEIFFENTRIDWKISKKEAEILCGQLNGAYNLGRSQGLVDSQFLK